jgi:lactoylglutathione lyase
MKGEKEEDILGANSKKKEVRRMVQDLFETHIHVADLEKSTAFYQQLPGMESAYFEERRRVRFFWIGERGRAMLGVWETDEPVKPQHFAFRVAWEEMQEAMRFLEEKGISVRNFLNDNSGDLYVHAWMPAVSVYFSDPDGHSLEYIAMLPDAPRPESGLVPWREWEKMHGRESKTK